MITVHWHLFIYIAIISYGLYLILKPKERAGDYSFGLEHLPALGGILIIIISTAVYGGIFWW